MSRVSIVVPCRNGADWLAPTLRSALNQTAPPAEVIVVDDGSTDDSVAIAEGFGPPVRVIAGPATGAADARNAGAAEATGDRIMFLDADDLLTPDAVGALGRALDGSPPDALAICPWDRLERGRSGEPLPPWFVLPPSNTLPRPDADALANWLTGTWSPPCCVLWTRSGFAASGGWNPGAGLDDDGELFRRALARGIHRAEAPDGLALYRRLPEGAVSYSGRRLQPFGIETRLNNFGATVDELGRGDRLLAYRAALAESASELLADARPHPELAVRVEALLTRIGGTRPWDAPCRRAGRLLARGAAWTRERRTRPATTPLRVTAAPVGGSPAIPLVSVVIPTFNRADFVVRAVESVLSQDYPSIEVLVVDDGSTDDTAARLDALADTRLRVLTQPNGGVARARNRGASEAAGLYVAFLDSDDFWLPGKLMAQVAAMEAAPSRAGFCYTGLEVRRPGAPSEVQIPTVSGSAFRAMLLDNAVRAPTSCGLVRREVFDAVGGFDPDLPAIEDWEWLIRVARLYDFVAVPEVLAVYRDHQNDERRSRDFRANMKARALLWERNAHALRRAGIAQPYLMESARRELREGDAARGRMLTRAMIWERPQNVRLWRWLPYSMAPSALRRGLRAVDADAYRRRQDRSRPSSGS